MSDELAILRKLAANPYDRATLGAYADWLAEQGRTEDEAGVRRVLGVRPPTGPANSLTIGELLQMPLDAAVIYTACSDYNELQPGDVTLIRAEDQRVVWREQQGYRAYDPHLYMTDEEVAAMTADQRRWRRLNLLKDERPNFVTVCHFPGN
jgi:uncharacterized protein (TIGR02996 family)